jgi:uncharacterized membrane-anchored protein YhcB (DUF1043 family)
MNQHNLIIFIAFVIGFAVGAICVLTDAEKEKKQAVELAVEKYKEDVEKVHSLVFERMKNYEDLWLTCDAKYTACMLRGTSALNAKDSALAALKAKAKQLPRAK